MELLDAQVQRMAGSIKRVIYLERVLEDRLDLAPKHLALTATHLADVAAPVEHLTARRPDDAEDQTRERRLATSALSGDRRHSRSVLVEDKRGVLQRDDALLAEFQPAAAKNLAHTPRFQQRR